MTELPDPEGLTFAGTLDSVVIEGDLIVALVYPFRSPKELGERLVLEIRFHSPRFPASELEGLVGEEIDLALTGTTAEVLSGFHDQYRFEAGSISVVWRAWTIADYHQLLETMSQQASEKDDDLSKLRGRLDRVASRLDDLLHRAELKEAGSPKQVAKQRPVIMALRQMKDLL